MIAKPSERVEPSERVATTATVPAPSFPAVVVAVAVRVSVAGVTPTVPVADQTAEVMVRALGFEPTRAKPSGSD